MLNFKESYTKGIKAAIDTTKNVKEIEDAINHFKSELENASDGKLSVFKKTSNILEAVKKNFLNSDNSELNDVIISICIMNDKSISEDITKLEYSPTGLPCGIYIDSIRYTCYTKEELLDGFSKLLASQSTGAKVLRLLKKSNSI